MNDKIQIDQEDKKTNDYKEDIEALFQDFSPSFFQNFQKLVTSFSEFSERTDSKQNNNDSTM